METVVKDNEPNIKVRTMQHDDGTYSLTLKTEEPTHFYLSSGVYTGLDITLFDFTYDSLIALQQAIGSAAENIRRAEGAAEVVKQ